MQSPDWDTLRGKSPRCVKFWFVFARIEDIANVIHVKHSASNKEIRIEMYDINVEAPIIMNFGANIFQAKSVLLFADVWSIDAKQAPTLSSQKRANNFVSIYIFLLGDRFRAFGSDNIRSGTADAVNIWPPKVFIITRIGDITQFKDLSPINAEFQCIEASVAWWPVV